jgi:hypothetical protein
MVLKENPVSIGYVHRRYNKFPLDHAVMNQPSDVAAAKWLIVRTRHTLVWHFSSASFTGTSSNRAAA